MVMARLPPPLLFEGYPTHYRMYFPDGSYIKFIEWMGVIADCSQTGMVNRIYHTVN